VTEILLDEPDCLLGDAEEADHLPNKLFPAEKAAAVQQIIMDTLLSLFIGINKMGATQ